MWKHREYYKTLCELLPYGVIVNYLHDTDNNDRETVIVGRRSEGNLIGCTYPKSFQILTRALRGGRTWEVHPEAELNQLGITCESCRYYYRTRADVPF